MRAITLLIDPYSIFKWTIHMQYYFSFITFLNYYSESWDYSQKYIFFFKSKIWDLFHIHIQINFCHMWCSYQSKTCRIFDLETGHVDNHSTYRQSRKRTESIMLIYIYILKALVYNLNTAQKQPKIEIFDYYTKFSLEIVLKKKKKQLPPQWLIFMNPEKPTRTFPQPFSKMWDYNWKEKKNRLRVKENNEREKFYC